jgi:hypothetical protein
VRNLFCNHLGEGSEFCFIKYTGHFTELIMKYTFLTLKYAEVEPEVNPKWQVLSEVLEEVDGLSKHVAERDLSCNKVLVLVEDSRTCNQIKQVGNVFKPQHEVLYNNHLQGRKVGVFHVTGSLLMSSWLIMTFLVTVSLRIVTDASFALAVYRTF